MTQKVNRAARLGPTLLELSAGALVPGFLCSGANGAVLEPNNTLLRMEVQS